MRKLKLELESLQVESFPVLREVGGPGTAYGHELREPDEQLPPMDDGWGYGGGANTVGTCIGPTYCCPPTWRQTCPATCYGTCPFSCDTFCAL